MNTIVERNKAIVSRFFEEGCNQRKTDMIKQVFAESFINNGSLANPKTVESYVNKLWDFFDKIQVDVIAQIAEEDRVSTFRIWKGTVKGRVIQWKQISIVRLSENKIVEDWVVEEEWRTLL